MAASTEEVTSFCADVKDKAAEPPIDKLAAILELVVVERMFAFSSALTETPPTVCHKICRAVYF